MKRCCFLHDWTKWEVLINEKHGMTYWRIVQKRECRKCGKVEISNKLIS